MSKGILLIDKPVGFSSFQIVSVFKKCHKKVGHAGTLDPFASGLLIILIGNSTKDFASYQQCAKEYIGEMLLGAATDTYDIAGNIIGLQKNMKKKWSIAELNDKARSFTGEIEQTPPKFSALKQDGMKLYELSRQGHEVEPKKRKVTVHEFSITGYDHPLIHFHTLVNTGVYVRSLAHAFGKSLGCGATLISLRRTRIGKHRIQEAKKIGEFLL